MTVPTHAVVVANNEAIHQATVSEQCLLIEKAEEIYDYMIRHGHGTQFGFLKGLSAKRWVRQLGEEKGANVQWRSTKCGPGAGGTVYSGPLTQQGFTLQKDNPIDNWNWMSLHEIPSNFDYIKVHSFGGPIDFMGPWKTPKPINAISAGPAQFPNPRDIDFFHPFFEITPAEKAQITHFCNVRVSYYDQDGTYVDEKDGYKSTVVPFNQNGTDLSYLTRPQSVKQLAGLQNITITHEGIDSVTKNIVLINATFVFQDLRKLVEEPFSQLLQLGNYIQSANLFRYIEFELGWDTANPTLKSKLDLDKLNLKTKANLIKYTFDLKDDGSMVVNATYRGSVVDVAGNTFSNILQLSKTVFEEIKNNNNAINAAARNNARRQANRLEEMRADVIADQIMIRTLMMNYSQFIHYYSTNRNDLTSGNPAAAPLGDDGRGFGTPESVRRQHLANWYVGPALMPTGGVVDYDDFTGFSFDRRHFRLGTYGQAHSNLDSTRTKMRTEMMDRLNTHSGLTAAERDKIKAELSTRLEQFFEGGAANSALGMREILQKLPSYRGQTGVATGRGSTVQIGFTNEAPSNGLRDSISSMAPGPTSQTNVAEWAGAKSQIHGGRSRYYLEVKNSIDAWLGMLSADDVMKRHREIIEQQDRDLKSIEDGIRQSYQAAAANAVSAAYKARFIALRHIAKSLLANTSVYSMYINKAQRSSIKEATVHEDKQVMIDAMNNLVPGGNDGYLTVKNPSGIRVKHAASGNDRPITEGYKADSTGQVEPFEFTEDDLEEYQVVPFVFLGDLLMSLLTLPADLREREDPNNPGVTLPSETVLDRIVKNSGRRFYTDLGQITYNRPFTNLQTENFNLYYYPISVKRLNDFFSREVLGKERQFYSYYDFCQDLIRKFLDNSFTACSREAHMQSFVSPKVRMAVFDHPGATGSTAGNIPGGSYPGSTHIFIWGSKNVKNDLAKHGIQKDTNFGDYATNMINGIYHFYLGGLNRGMALSVKVIDIADPNTKTAVYYNAGRSSERANASANSHRQGDWAPVIFQANVETLGYPLFELGNLIYVDLSPYVTNEHRQMRQFAANGYYGVKKVTHNWSESKYTTNIESIIQYSTEDAINVATGVPLPGTVKTTAASPATSRTVQEVHGNATRAAERTKPVLEGTARDAKIALQNENWRRPPE